VGTKDMARTAADEQRYGVRHDKLQEQGTENYGRRFSPFQLKSILKPIMERSVGSSIIRLQLQTALRKKNRKN
jgi:hypothetical protein